MILIRPQAINTTTLLSSNVPDTLETWNSATLYPLAARVRSGPLANGTFASTTSGWTPANATLAVVSGAMRITNSGGQGSANQAISTVAGQTYTLFFDIIDGTTTGSVGVGTSLNNPDLILPGVGAGLGRTVTFVATGTTTYIIPLNYGATAGQYCDFDNISVDFGDATTHRVYESLSGGTSATATMAIASPCVVTWTSHGLAANTPITFTTTGALPTGLAVGTVYYVLAPTTNTFNVSATAGGAAINTSGSQSGVHTAVANPNLNKPVTDPTFWLDTGPTNKWAMFDNYNGTATTDAALIDMTLSLTGRIDSLALFNLANAVSARIVVSTVADGTLYDQTFSLITTEGIADWYDYFFEEIASKEKLLVTGLPVYASPSVRLILTGNATATMQCGTCVVGLSKNLGRTLYDGAQVGITDYSRKEADDFGNYTIVERAFSDRGSFHMRITKAAVDGVKRVLADFRATPAVYSASEDYDSSLIFGFFREFNVEIDYPLESLVSIEIEGLT